MALFGRRFQLKHLGGLRGSGELSINGGATALGMVTYEIDGYLNRLTSSANGQIEGSGDMLARAFDAGAARIALADGQWIEIILADPEGDTAAEVKVSGPLPRFAARRQSPRQMEPVPRA